MSKESDTDLSLKRKRKNDKDKGEKVPEGENLDLTARFSL